MERSMTLLYYRQQGRLRKNYNWDAIGKQSAVIVTAAEYGERRTATHDVLDIAVLREANVYVTNIGPHDPEGGTGGVEFFLHVDRPAPLDVLVTITVLDPIERFQVVA